MGRSAGKSSDGSAGVGGADAPFCWRTFFGALGSVLVVLMLVGVLAGLVVGSRPLERRVARLDSVTPTRVDIRWPVLSRDESGAIVTWVPSKEREALVELAKAALAGDLERFSSEPLQRVGKAMESSGWFSGSPSVRRVGSNVVEISGAWRAPAAVVRRDGVDQLISWDGFPMPLAAEPGSTRFPVINQPALPAPRTSAGTVDTAAAWPGEDIAASLELLRVLLTQPWASQVAGVDAAAFADGRSLVVLTTSGTRVVWGGRFTRPALGEVSSDRKLAHITELYRTRGRIDAGLPMVYINQTKLQFDISATAEALAAQRQAQQAAELAGR